MTLWVPPSFYDKQVTAIRDAVKRYDYNLEFGKNEETGQWCVFLKHGTMGASKDKDLPILGFNELPSPDHVVERLYKSDAFRRGQEIVDEIQKHNDHLQDDSKYKDADGEMAEYFDWGMRKMNHPNAPIKIYLGR